VNANYRGASRANRSAFSKREDFGLLSRLVVRFAETARESFKRKTQADGIGTTAKSTVTGGHRGLPELGPNAKLSKGATPSGTRAGGRFSLAEQQLSEGAPPPPRFLVAAAEAVRGGEDRA
jgi:hypothetical protein